MLIVLATTLTDTSRSFGLRNEVELDPAPCSAAATWGGNPRGEVYAVAAKNDGNTIHKLVKATHRAFWSPKPSTS